MRFRISMIILILLSFFNIGAFSNDKGKVNSFDELVYLYADKSKFIENGSKVQYKTKNDIHNEMNRINQYFNNINGYNYEYLSENKLEFYNKSRNIKIESWKDDIYCYITITLIDNNECYRTYDLLGILKELINKDCEEVQYYSYYKGAVSFDYENEYINNISSCISECQILDLTNGYTGSGYCNNGEKINFSISNYDTGAYVIIGTPIIFTTY